LRVRVPSQPGYHLILQTIDCEALPHRKLLLEICFFTTSALFFNTANIAIANRVRQLCLVAGMQCLTNRVMKMKI
jgi:hypothetical protein